MKLRQKNCSGKRLRCLKELVYNGSEVLEGTRNKMWKMGNSGRMLAEGRMVSWSSIESRDRSLEGL